MGCILIGIILGVLLIVWSISADHSGGGRAALGALVISVGIVVGIFVPVSGFHAFEETARIELVSLSDQTISTGKGIIYVAITGENSYTYYIEVDNKFGASNTKAYKSQTITGNNITIVEGDIYEGATLVIYEAKSKKSFWTFALNTKTEYVFYVPTGTISRNVSLG